VNRLVRSWSQSKLISTLYCIVIPTIGCVLDVLMQLQLHCDPCHRLEPSHLPHFPPPHFPASHCPLPPREPPHPQYSVLSNRCSHRRYPPQMWNQYARKHLHVYLLDGVFHCDLRVELLCFIRNWKYQMALPKLQYLYTMHHHLGHDNEVSTRLSL